MKEKQIIKKKLFYYILSLFFSLIFLFLITYIFNVLDRNSVLYFNSIKFAILASVLGFLLWLKKFPNNIFEQITVYVSQLFICLFVAYIGPMTLDRSLSSFMIFYSVQNGSISKDIKDEIYFDDFIKRRYNDAIKIGYFNCDEKICFPTYKAKLTYYLFYPTGILTHSLGNYYNFKAMADKFSKNEI